MPEISEQEMIDGCLRQEHYWQQQLHIRYYGVLLKVCARYAGNPEDAEQMAQDAFLRIFSRMDSFKNAGSFEGWMKRITVNICLDALRSKVGKAAARPQAVMPSDDYLASDLVQDGLQQLLFKDLLTLIQGLPDLTRTVFNLYVFDGHAHKQISAALGITENNSSQHVHLARQILQKKIKTLHLQYHSYAGK